MSLALFYILAALTLVAGVGVVTARNVVYAALFLLASLTGVAGLFVLAYAEFLALVQVLIYGGAVTIVILFALMLTRRTEYEVATEHRRFPLAAMVAGGLFALLAITAYVDAGTYNTTDRRGIDLSTLGVGLFENWAVPFEIASILLLVALIGAIVVGRTTAEDDGEESDQ